MNKVGIIGVGSMGRMIIENLIDADYKLTIYNRTRSKLNIFTNIENISIAGHLYQVFESCNKIICCVTDDSAIETILFNKEIKHWNGKYIVDLSSISQSMALRCYEYCKKRGANYFDAPVSGGVEGARKGTLSIMVGGDEHLFQSIYPLLKNLGDNIVYVGDSGSGAITKQLNQIIVAAYLAGISEAFALADCAGMNKKLVYDAIKTGYAQSRVLESKIENILSDDYPLGGRVSIHRKDLDNVLEFARTHELIPELTFQFRAMFTQAEEMGFGNLDHSVIYKLFKEKVGGKSKS